MKDELAVNHPSHYEKGNGHIECIDLLDYMTAGYTGIFAMEIGQAKYLYRAGSKSEDGLTQKEKSIQDVKKFLWYMRNFYKKAEEYIQNNPLLTFYDIVYSNGKKLYVGVTAEFLKKEFTFDKPDYLKEDIAWVVGSVYRLQNLADVAKVIERLEIIIKKLEGSDVAFVNI